jgi:type I restriction enzyme S subunit
MASAQPTAKAGWEYKTLGEMCDIVNGATPKTKVAEYWEGSHQWITPAEMGNRETPYISNTNRTLTDSGLANCSASLLPAKSVILSSRAPIGHLVINDVPMAFNQGCKGLVPPKDLEYKFLYYFLFSSVELLNSLGTGATFKELSATKLKQVPFPVPPLAEQERIVGILDEAFEGIAAAAAQAEKNLHNARELFQSVLQSTFSLKGDDWVETTLGEAYNFKNGINFNKNQKGEEGTLTIDVLNMYTDSTVVNTGELYRVNKEIKEDYLLKKGDILFVRSSVKREGVGWPAVFQELSQPVTYCGFIIRARPAKSFEINPEYAVYYLRQEEMRESVVSKAKQATITNINQEILSKVTIYLPPLQIQQAIVEKLDALSEETKRLEAIYECKKAALSELKQSLLQKAFAGEL